jgi:hypothetical protein
MLSRGAFEALDPVFASHGWVFFGPYRRGQGLSASAGPSDFSTRIAPSSRLSATFLLDTLRSRSQIHMDVSC